MTGSRMRPAILFAGLFLGLLAVTLQGVQGEELEKVPSEDQCRPYIEKALKDLGTEGSPEHSSTESTEATDGSNDEGTDSATDANENDDESGSREKRDISTEDQEDNDNDGNDASEGSENEVDQEQAETVEVTSAEGEEGQDNVSDQTNEDANADSKEDDDNSKETEGDDSQEKQEDGQSTEDADGDSGEGKTDEEIVVEEESEEQKKDGSEQENDDTTENDDNDDSPADDVESEEQKTEEDNKSGEEDGKSGETENSVEADGDGSDSKEDTEGGDDEHGESTEDGTDDQKDDSKEDEGSKSEEKPEEDSGEDKKSIEEEEIVAKEAGSLEQEADTTEVASEETKSDEDGEKSEEGDKDGTDSKEDGKESKEDESGKSEEGGDSKGETEGEDSSESTPEEELIMEIEIPEILRPREHINQLLKLDEENESKEKAVENVADIVLRDLKRLYDNAIKPLETLYKYRDLSNRHFGDPEIFSKPLVLFMGPWSGGKSSIINYLLDIEYKPTSLRTGAEPSPAYFNILMHGEEEEVLDGTQLAADWTFSGLQKFGQGLLDRLKGYKLNNKLLEKVNIVEIPGILEIRKQVQRLFPFNDACQWFIDRADIIFLVYDPSKLDVGPETEAILDQLKGREYQTRIILNKADQVKPEELMRVQGALIWNISPLMSSAEPPIMYSTSLWSIPYEAGAPTRLLYAQERAFLRDLRSAVDKRVEHKIASARRFAVRVRNHAKMVDCYLTTYYNHKSFFAKKKDISDRIIENPQDYHIYEGLSTLTNISRYDLPDPDVYRDFFRLNSLYDFPLLSSTCTYFRGCPINRLDVAIAYDLPELVGKYKKSVEAALHKEEEQLVTPAPQVQSSQQKPTARSGASRMTMS